MHTRERIETMQIPPFNWNRVIMIGISGGALWAVNHFVTKMHLLDPKMVIIVLTVFAAGFLTKKYS